jgi:membrane protein
MLANAWAVVKETVTAFVEDEAMTRGAAIAFYAVTAIGPVLLLVIALAGLVYGQAAASDAIVGRLRDLMGEQGATLLQTVIKGAASKRTGILAGIVGVVTLLATASGAFSEVQAALNAFWKAKPEGSSFIRLIWTRVVGLGLVVAMGAILVASFVVSAALAAFGDLVGAWLPAGNLILHAANLIVSVALITLMFAVIYKVLPDTKLAWRDVLVGAFVTALLFSVGKYLVGFYIGYSAAGSSYGAAGALIVVLLWIYYSSEIFLLGAELTKAYAIRYGSRRGRKEAPRRGGQLGAGTQGRPRVAEPHPGMVRSRQVLTLIALAGLLIRSRWKR